MPPPALSRIPPELRNDAAHQFAHPTENTPLDELLAGLYRVWPKRGADLVVVPDDRFPQAEALEDHAELLLQVAHDRIPILPREIPEQVCRELGREAS